MSNSVLPSFPGLAWNVSRKPLWSTVVKTSTSGREYRRGMWTYPRWQYKLSYEVLRARTALTEMQQLAAFFNARGGNFDTWLYQDPDDSVATMESFGIGNGATLSFQLARNFGGFIEPIYDYAPAPLIYVNGVLKASPADYSISSSGLVTFTSPPGGAVIVQWTGAFYFRCRFLSELLDFNQFMRQFWELRSLEFITVKP